MSQAGIAARAFGTARPELRPDIRSTPSHGYVIFFKYRDEEVEIVTILEWHRDIGRHFAREVWRLNDLLDSRRQRVQTVIYGTGMARNAGADTRRASCLHRAQGV